MFVLLHIILTRGHCISARDPYDELRLKVQLHKCHCIGITCTNLALCYKGSLTRFQIKVFYEYNGYE